jgi:hypothetical protein
LQGSFQKKKKKKKILPSEESWAFSARKWKMKSPEDCPLVAEGILPISSLRPHQLPPLF